VQDTRFILKDRVSALLRRLRAVPPEVDPRVFAFSIATMVLMMGVGVIAPVLPLYAREFGASYGEAGVLVAAFAIGRLAFDYLGGVLSDRLPARWLAGGGAALASLSALGSALAPTYSFLFACRILEGIGSAFYVTTAMACRTRTLTPDMMFRVRGSYQAMVLLGVSFGPAMGGFVASIAGLRAPFLVQALLAAVVAATAGRLVADMPPPHPKAGDGGMGVRSMLRSRPFLFALVLATLIFGTRAGLRMNLIPLYADDVLHIDEFHIGIILSAAAFVNFLVLRHAGSLIDHYGRRRIVLPVLAGMVAVIACFPLAPSFAWFLIGNAFLGAAIGFLAPAPAAVIADVTPAEASGAAMGLYRTAGDLGLLLGPVVFGFVANGFGLAAGFWCSAALVAAVWLFGSRTRETLGSATRNPSV